MYEVLDVRWDTGLFNFWKEEINYIKIREGDQKHFGELTMLILFVWIKENIYFM